MFLLTSSSQNSMNLLEGNAEEIGETDRIKNTRTKPSKPAEQSSDELREIEKEFTRPPCLYQVFCVYIIAFIYCVYETPESVNQWLSHSCAFSWLALSSLNIICFCFVLYFILFFVVIS